MQRSYSTFVMLKHAMSLSVFLEFSSNASEFSFSLLIIHSTFRLAFPLLCALSKILFKLLTMMKVQYPLIHTKQHTHPFLLILMVTMVVVRQMHGLTLPVWVAGMGITRLGYG